MQARMNIATISPELYQSVLALDTAVRQSGIKAEHLHLIKLRASQINGCAYCVDMHVKHALADGMNPQKLHLVVTWKESPLFDAKERALLAWTESVTLLAQTGAPDDVYEALKAEFSDVEIARFTVAIGTINVWNRIAVTSRSIHPTGSQSAH
jgi:AhpD family alkylhydroperoxidase